MFQSVIQCNQDKNQYNQSTKKLLLPIQAHTITTLSSDKHNKFYSISYNFPPSLHELIPSKVPNPFSLFPLSSESFGLVNKFGI